MTLIEKKFEAAVGGLKEDWFKESSLKWFDYVNDLPYLERLTYCILVFDNQVFNGGFHQYFTNGYGQFAPRTIEYLNEIGAPRKAKILKEAFRTVNVDSLENLTFAQMLMNEKIDALFKDDSLFEPIEELDNEYENLSEENLQILLENFLQVKS